MQYIDWEVIWAMKGVHSDVWRNVAKNREQLSCAARLQNYSYQSANYFLSCTVVWTKRKKYVKVTSKWIK